MKTISGKRINLYMLCFCYLGLIPFSAVSAKFSTNFEAVPDQVNPTLTTTVINNALSADFTGATIDQIGLLFLYNSGVKSWMVAPNGDTAPLATDVSTGTGTITLSEGAVNVRVFGRNESVVTVSEVRLIDENGMMINSAISLTNTNWTEIDVTRISGEPLIASVQLVVLSGTGTGMAVLDDFSFDTTESSITNTTPVGNPSGGSRSGPL